MQTTQALFTSADYQALSALVFRPDYPGFRPGVLEAPNGDGVIDREKAYAHVADKYLPLCIDSDRDACSLFDYLTTTHSYAGEVAERLGVPLDFFPSYRYGALRVLSYPSGASSALHCDFDLFTLNLYRNVPNAGLPEGEVHMGELGELLGLGKATPHQVHAMDMEQESIVYFAIPDHAARLPGGGTVGEWIAERIGRSRVQMGDR